MTSIEEDVIKIVGDYLGIPVFRLSLETNMTKGLKTHPVDIRELIITVEEQFGIKIPIHEIAQIKRIQDIIKAVERALEESKKKKH